MSDWILTDGKDEESEVSLYPTLSTKLWTNKKKPRTEVEFRDEIKLLVVVLCVALTLLVLGDILTEIWRKAGPLLVLLSLGLGWKLAGPLVKKQLNKMKKKSSRRRS